MGYSPATDDGEILLTDSDERAFFLSQAMLAPVEHGLTNGLTVRLWTWLCSETLAKGRTWVAREHITIAKAIGGDSRNIRRILQPLVAAGLVDYRPGRAAMHGKAGRISAFEVTLDTLGTYQPEADPLREPECTCACTCDEEAAAQPEDDFSGLPEVDEDDEGMRVVDVTGSREWTVAADEGIAPPEAPSSHPPLHLVPDPSTAPLSLAKAHALIQDANYRAAREAGWC